MRKTIAILVAAGLTLPMAAHALDERVWLMLNGIGGTYSMSVINDDMDYYNATYGTNFKHIESGHSFGGAAGFETQGHWNYGLGFDRLDATTASSDSTGTVEYGLGANAWRMFAEYAMRPIGHSTLFLGGAVGLVQENGKIIVTAPGYPPDEYKTNGAGPLFEGYAGGNLWITGRFGLTTTVGYRYARVKQPKLEGGYPLTTASGAPWTLDFSGPTARVGIRLTGN